MANNQQPVTQDLNTDSEKVVLALAEHFYSKTFNAELEHADPEIQARAMLISEEAVDYLIKNKLIILPSDLDKALKEIAGK